MILLIFSILQKDPQRIVRGCLYIVLFLTLYIREKSRGPNKIADAVQVLSAIFILVTEFIAWR